MDFARTMPWAEAVDKVKSRLGLVANTPNSAAFIQDILVTVNQSMWHAMGEDMQIDRFVLKVSPDGHFWAPPGYGSLDAINIQGAPAPIRDKFYEFHQNGPGSVGMWRRPQTVKVGTFATMLDSGSADYFSIGVSAEFPERNARVVVEGEDRAGNTIKTFVQAGESFSGELFTPDANMVISSQILWRAVTRVRKNATAGPVHVWAYPDGDMSRGQRIASMQGRAEGNTLYTKYELGACQECCGWPYVEGRMRIEHPTGPSEHVWVASIRALVMVASAARDSLMPGGDASQKEEALKRAAEIAAMDFRQAESGRPHRPEVDTNLFGESQYGSV